MGKPLRICALLAAFASVVLAAGTHRAAQAAPCRSVTSAAAAPCPLAVQVHVTQTGMNPAAASETPTTATCTKGTTLVGGGILQDRDNGALPTNGLRVHGDVPSSPSGAFAENGSEDPTSWTAVGGFGGTGETGDEVKAFALCASNGPNNTLVVSKTAKGPTGVAATKKLTVTCPSGSWLIGGGGATHPASEPSLKTIGSYPSTAQGTPFTSGRTDPRSWTAVGAAGGLRFGTGEITTTVFALCSVGVPVHTVVARKDVIDHPAGPGSLSPGSDPFVILTATCKRGTTLLGGGVLADGDKRGPDVGVPQQGVHVRGSYPSNAKGLPVGDDATSIASWTGIVQAGGQPTPGTDSHVFALCED
ncbi:MAG TPA: hypothetical protein VH063_02100 [Gaiellaceae bacterium]|jgi:hypothetical protein|nr:hypothetical protein [Gaiellaceae bacterium]